LSEDRPVDDDPPPEGISATPEGADQGAGLEPTPDAEAALAYHQRARLAEDRLAEVLTAYRNLKKETEGFRDRMSRNMERRFQQRHARLLMKFMDILDNLDRALEAAQSSWAGQPLLEGMILVRTLLLQTLKAEGLERIPVLGMPFDPHVSEAVGTQPVSEPDQDHVVVKELMRGYRLHGKIARASRVVIGAYKPGQEGMAKEPSAPGDVSVGTLEDVAETPPEETAPPGDTETEDASLEAAEVPETDGPEAALEQLVDPPAESPEPGASPREEEPSLEDIIRRAEAQEALSPHAFGHVDDEDK
jgi:molecular chaperone GrpE